MELASGAPSPAVPPRMMRPMTAVSAGGGARLGEREMAVTRHLLVHGPSTRADLGDLLALSSASMSRTARALVAQGIASETVEPPVAVGRPRQILAAVPSARHVVGC